MRGVRYEQRVPPRLIPAEPDFVAPAEKVVWQHLRDQLPDDAFLGANIGLQSHDDFYEADVVVGLPGFGFAVIEVKGGAVAHTDDGWVQFTPRGPRTMDPAKQANRGKRLLDSYVQQRGWSHGPIRFEHLVAFPDVDFDDSPPAPDLARWALIARGDLGNAAECVQRALHERVSHHPRPTAEWVEEFADLVGGRPSPAMSLLGAVQARDDLVNRLTAEQNGILQYVSDNPLLRVVGGPGTGKTWLALERARLWAEEGRTSLFVCYSRGLARWLAKAVEAMPPSINHRITVRTFHSLAVQLGVQVPDQTDQDWWVDELPQLMMPLVSPRYDALVVDEAQDFADSWWPPLLASLRREQVFVVGDDQQTVFSGRRGTPDLHMAQLSLRENVRNTVEIAAVVNPLARDRMNILGGQGAPVRFVACASDEVYEVADREVERLLDEGFEPGHIAVLTTQHRHPNHRRAEEQLGKDGYWDGYWMNDEVFYGTVMGFKGLERPVVVLAVDGFRPQVGRDVMYAGLSRARDRLVVCGDLDEIRTVVGDEVCRKLTSG